MAEITLQERYDYFLETFDLFGTFLLKKDDEEIGYLVFEDFIVNVTSFLHVITLDYLLENKKINDEIYELCLKLREEVLALEDTKLWNIQEIKTNKKWHDLMLLSDTIKNKL